MGQKMNTSCDDQIKYIIQTRKNISSKTLTSTRLIILTLLYNYDKIGIQYRELKQALGLSDGNLYSNLSNLIEMGFIQETEIVLDNRTMKIYNLTKKGKSNLRKIMEWVCAIKNLLNNGDEEC